MRIGTGGTGKGSITHTARSITATTAVTPNVNPAFVNLSSVASGNAQAVVITPANGGSISSVYLNNIYVSGFAGQTGATTYNVPHNGRAQTLLVNFVGGTQTDRYTVTVSPLASPSGKGIVRLNNGNLSTSSVAGILNGAAAVDVTALPIATYRVVSISVNGAVVPGASSTVAGAGVTTSLNNAYLAAHPATTVTATFAAANMVTNVTLGASTYVTAIGGAQVFLNAGCTSPYPVTYTFNLVSGSGVFTSSQLDGRLTLTPAAVGTATFTVTANDGVVSATSSPVTLSVQPAGAADVNACLTCHRTRDPQTASYLTSAHATDSRAAFVCSDCHLANADHFDKPPAVQSGTFNLLSSNGQANGRFLCFSQNFGMECHAGAYTSNYTNRLAISYHYLNYNSNNCATCHGADIHNQTGSFDKCDRCHSPIAANTMAGKHYTAIEEGSCRTCHTSTVYYGYNATPTVDPVAGSMTFTRPSSASASKHRPETFKWASSDRCAVCHAGIRTEFRATAHWNNHLEYNSVAGVNGATETNTFTGGARAGEANANESWTTYENGSLMTCATRCHFKPNLGPNPRATDGSTFGLRPGKDECVACHEPHAANVATYQSTCMTCHNGKKHGVVPSEFWNSKHWDNHTESGPEFANQIVTTLDKTNTNTGGTVTNTGTTVAGVLNANDAYQTTEDGAVVTCAYRCHFRPGMGPYQNVSTTSAVLRNGHSVSYVTYSDTLNNRLYTRPGGNACMACHDAHGLEASYQTCLTCHTGGKHGKVPTEFWGSKHWQNHFEYDPATMRNQGDYTVQNGNVKSLGTQTAGYLDANDSYTTEELDTKTSTWAVVSCAYRCHFRPGMGPQQNVAGYLANGKATTYVRYSSIWNGQKYTRPGGDACFACHDAHALEASARSTCYTCHTGKVTSHGWSVAEFEKSSHFTGYYATLEGIGGPTGGACTECHDAHSTEAPFYTMATGGTAIVAGSGCQKCHAGSYGIFNDDGTPKAGAHFKTTTTSGNAFAYVQQLDNADNAANCTDCHYHNNTVNAGWAEGGHGALGSPWNRLSATDKRINIKTSPWVGSSACARCHSAKGFAYFVDSSYSNMSTVNAITYLGGPVYSPLTCNGCHVAKSAGTKQFNGKIRGNVNATYTVYAGVSSARNYFTANVVNSLSLMNNKNSTICYPCHSPRSQVGQNIKSAFAVAGADAAKSAGQFATHHGDYVGTVFNGVGGYDFSTSTNPATVDNNFGYQDRARHQRIGNYSTDPAGYNGTGNVKGSCVFCHMGKAGATHSLEAVITSDTCYKCHPSNFTQSDIDAAKADYSAAVQALGNLIKTKTFQQTGTKPGTGTDMTLGTNAEKNIGAWFNYNMLNGGDAGAFVHNPSYARRLLADSLDWMDDGIMNNSGAQTVFRNLSSTGGGAVALTADQISKAQAALQNPGCMGCHFGTGPNNLNGEAIPGVEQMPHFNTTGLVVPGESFTQAQFVVPGAQCNNCHGYGHGTDSPSYSAAKASFPQLSSVQGQGILRNYAESAHGETVGLAWTDYDFKTRSSCVVCHTTKGFVDAVNNANANGGRVQTAPAWGTTADTAKQVLACNACHSSTAWKTSIRNITGGYVAGMGGYPGVATIAYPDVAQSNVCIPCHASRENGASMIAAVTDYTNSGFKNPHYLAAAAVFYGKGGFQFYTSGVRYNTYGAAGKVGKKANWSHGRLGMDNYSTTTNATVLASGAVIPSGNKGQCVACHMGPTNTHTFGALETAIATQGTSTYTRGCYGCHNGTDMPMSEFIEEEKVIWDRLFDFFAWNFTYNPDGTLRTTPIYFNGDKNAYFFTDAAFTTGVTNWTQAVSGGTGAQTMGAAQNLKLLTGEKGSFVHNRSFGRALAADSIIYLQTGSVGSDWKATAADQNGIINFSGYSTARPTDPSGHGVSITTLKSYLTKAASIPGQPDGFTRR